MQVDLTSVLAAASTVASVGVAAWLATARYALANRDAELDRRIDANHDEIRSVSDRLHAEEKSTIRQDGEINRVKDTHENLSASLSDIRRTMVTKNEFASLEKAIERLHQDFARTGRSSSGHMPRAAPGSYASTHHTTTSSPPPPRPDRK